ncbi:MAG: hypothetical protein ACN2B6_08160 [Rickettsiales bacterium]
MNKALLTSLMIFSSASAYAYEQSAMPASEWPASASPAAGSVEGSGHTTNPMYIRARDGEIIDSTGGGAIPALPLTVMSNGTMKYVTGGIGEEELLQLKNMENDFNVRMLIASKDGQFVGDATVRVVDTKDTVLFTVPEAGPYFYVSLPAGKYIFEVTDDTGNLRTVTVKAPASGHSEPVVRF